MASGSSEYRVLPARSAPDRPTIDRVDRVLATGTTIMAIVVVVAVARGYGQWARVPGIIWLHLITIAAALVLSPILLLSARGTRRHRRIGWAWAIAMVATATASLFIADSATRHFSPIHLLSVATLIGVPRLVWLARHHRVRDHRTIVRIVVAGALITAGFFTLPFGRMLGRWLLG